MLAERKISNVVMGIEALLSGSSNEESEFRVKICIITFPSWFRANGVKIKFDDACAYPKRRHKVEHRKGLVFL